MPLSPHVPDLGALDMLLSVARLGSLGRAAEEHGVTQPAVSARIARMEKLLGLALIERGAHGSTLTPSGSMVVDWAREVVEAAASLERGAMALRSQGAERVRVASSMTIAEYLMPVWLATSQVEEPSLTVSLDLANSRDVAVRVIGGQADLGFVEGPERPRGLRSETVGRDRLVVVVAKSHEWANRRRPLSPAELAATPLIQRERGSGTRSTLRAALTVTLGHDHPVAPAMMELTSTTAIKGAVHAGLGPAVISSIAVEQELRHGRLRAVPIAELDLTRTLRVVWPVGHSLLGPARTFVALARRAHAARKRVY